MGGFSMGVQKSQNVSEIERIILDAEDGKRVLERGGLLITISKTSFFKEPNLPEQFNLSREEQKSIIFDWVKDTTGFEVNDFNALFQAPVLNGSPFLLVVGNTNERLVLAKKTIYGDLYTRPMFHENHGFIQENFITSFGHIQSINGNVGINSVMKDFGSLRRVGGDLWFSGHITQNLLKSISPLSIVNGNLNLKNTNLSLESLVEVRGNLNLRFSKSTNLVNLKEVRGNVLISKSEKDSYDFTNVEVGGKVKYFNDKF